MISPYVRGRTVSKEQDHLEDRYQTNISEDLTSSITDRVIEEVTTWRNRFLDGIYPILYLDCIHLKATNNLIITPTVVKDSILAIGVTKVYPHGFDN